jgi:hypothetical protein
MNPCKVNAVLSSATSYFTKARLLQGAAACVVAYFLAYFLMITALENRFKFGTSVCTVHEDTSHVPDNAVYLLETSGRDELTLKQYCSVESAAMHNPSTPVAVGLLASELRPSKVKLALLNTYKNLLITKIDLNEWLKGTPFATSTHHGKAFFEKLEKTRFEWKVLIHYKEKKF